MMWPMLVSQDKLFSVAVNTRVKVEKVSATNDRDTRGKVAGHRLMF
jgi:hypothetical protein